MEVKDPIDPNLPPEPETGELLLQRVVRDLQNLDNNSALPDLGHDEAVLPDQLMSMNQQFANQEQGVVEERGDMVLTLREIKFLGLSTTRREWKYPNKVRH